MSTVYTDLLVERKHKQIVFKRKCFVKNTSIRVLLVCPRCELNPRPLEFANSVLLLKITPAIEYNSQLVLIFHEGIIMSLLLLLLLNTLKLCKLRNIFKVFNIEN